MKKLIALCICAVVVGCVSTPKIVKITPENKDIIDGVRFYMPKAYLLIAEKDVIVDGKEKKYVGKDGKEVIETEKMALPERDLVASITYLPNPKEQYAVMNVSKDNRINLVDGWRLEGINLQENELKSNKHVLEVLTGMKDLEPGVYEILYNEAGSIETLKKVQIIK